MKRILAMVLLAALLAVPAWAEQTTVTNAAELASALANGLFDTINIAPGTYSGQFTVARPVELAGDSRTRPVLDGGGNGTVLTIRGAEVTLRDIIVQNGRAQYGAAVYANSGANVTVTGCVFRNNYDSCESQYSFAAGAVYVNDSCTITLTDCDFTDNTAVAGDGAGFCSYGKAALTNCSFTGNVNRSTPGSNYTIRDDGAAYFGGGSAVLTDCSFTNNRNEGRTAGVYLDNVPGAVLQGCEFKNNTGDTGVALGISTACENVTVKDCDFTGNKIIEEDLSGKNLSGGAVNCLSKALFINCAFVDNGGENCEYGGGINFSYEGGNSTLINCLFTGNSAVRLGSEEYYPKGKGGAYYVNGQRDQKLTFIHCTLAYNKANEGAEIVYDEVTERFVNCVIWHDGDTAYKPWTSYEPDEPPVTFDSCAVSSSFLTPEIVFQNNNCALINNQGCRPISGGTAVRVTYTRPNKHSVEVVQTSGIKLENASDSLTGKSLSSIAGGYEVEQDLLSTDLTSRARAAAAPELGAVNSGEVNPPAPPQVNPPVITSFTVEGASGGAMVLGRSYTATAAATGEGVTWTIEADGALTCSDPKSGNSTTFTITPNTAGDGAKVTVRAQNEGGAAEPKTLTFNVTEERNEKEEKAQEMNADPQAVDPQGLNITAQEIVKADMTLADLDSDLRSAVTGNSRTPLAILPEIQPQQNGTYYIKTAVNADGTGVLRFFTGDGESAADAVFYDENWNRITSVDPSVRSVIVAAPLEAGKTYTPVVAAENPEEPHPPVRPDNESHSSGGCNSGFGILSLLPLFGLFVLKKK